jgi:hypothetical protein
MNDRQAGALSRLLERGGGGAQAAFLLLLPVLTVGAAVASLAMQGARPADFNQFYSASKLVGTGKLYDWESIHGEQAKRMETTLGFGRLPAFAFLFKSVGWLPFGVGRALWLLAGLGAIVAAAWMWPAGTVKHFVWFVSWSLPAIYCLAIGQDTVLFLFFAVLAFRLMESGRGFAGGLALGACLAKFHLGLGIAVFLLARRRWGAILGAGCAAAALVAGSFALEGPGWPAGLWSVMKNPEFTPAPYKMPTFAGLAHGLPAAAVVEGALGIALLGLAWRAARGNAPAAEAYALALASGLAVSHHAYMYDAVVLLPLLASAAAGQEWKWLRVAAVALSTPLYFIALLAGPATAPFAHAFLGVFYFGAAWAAARRSQ